MAENKKSFVLYVDLIHTVEKLTDEEAGKLFKHLLTYVNDRSTESTDRITDIIFEPIKRQLKRDLIKYESKRNQWSHAGKLSAEKRKKTKIISTESTDVANRSTDSTVNVNVNDNVNVIQTIHKAENEIKDLKKKKPLPGPVPIPTKAEFIEYVKQAIPDKYPALAFAIDMKYTAWVVAGWSTGGKTPRPIKNWKTTILNTIPYLNGEQPAPASKILSPDRVYNIKNY